MGAKTLGVMTYVIAAATYVGTTELVRAGSYKADASEPRAGGGAAAAHIGGPGQDWRQVKTDTAAKIWS